MSKSIQAVRELLDDAAKQQAIIDAHHADGIDRAFALEKLARLYVKIGYQWPIIQSLLASQSAERVRELEGIITKLQSQDVMMRRSLLQIQKLCNDTGDLDMEEFAGDVQEIAVAALEFKI